MPATSGQVTPDTTSPLGTPGANALVSAAAVSGTSGCSNEPAGFTKVMDDPFDTSPNGVAWNTDKWSTALVGTQNNLQIISDNSGPKSPGKVLRVVYPAGSPGGASPARMGLATFPANAGKFYMCTFIRLSSNWTNNGNTGTKFVFLKSAVEGGQYGLNHYFNLSPTAAFNLQANGPPSLTRNFTSSATLGGGGWKKLEALIDGGSTAAAGDGTIKLWVDGAQVVNASKVKMFFDGQKVEWKLLWLDPTYGGGLNKVPATQWFDIDNWYVSVGTSSGPVTAPPPAATLTKVTLTPATVSVKTGATQQMAVSGTYSNGTTGTPSVTYTATGGTISAAGLYTAGATAGTFRVIATQQGGTLADTSAVTVTTTVTAPTLTALSLTPAAVSVAAGATTQLSAKATYSNGTTGTPTATWSATGGSVSSTGMYTAGATAGLFRVIASSGGRADTAAVTVTSSSSSTGGTSGCTNEPAGYTTVMNESFDTSPNGPAWNSGKWSTALVGTQNNLQIVSDNSGPKSPGKILRVMYPAGSSGGASPARMGFAPFPANTGKFYMCVFVRLSANWSNGGNTGTKFVFLRSAVETGPQALNHYFNLSPDVAFNLQGGSLTRNYNSSATLGGGGWKKLEAVIDGGTTAAANDGTIKIWVDGTQVVNSSNVKMFFDGQAVAWNLLWLDPTFGGGLNPVPATQWFDIDNWYASVK